MNNLSQTSNNSIIGEGLAELIRKQSILGDLAKFPIEEAPNMMALWGADLAQNPMEPTLKSGALLEEYLTISEVAARLKVKPKTVRNKMASGVFRQGVHYI